MYINLKKLVSVSVFDKVQLWKWIKNILCFRCMNSKFYLPRQKVCWSTNYALQRTSNWTVFMTHRFLSLFCVYHSRSSKTQTLKNPTKNGRNIRFVKIQFNLEKIPTFCVSSRKTSSFVGNNLQTKHFKYVSNGFQCLMERELEYWSKSMCTMIL